jgi:hypothetical protein
MGKEKSSTGYPEIEVCQEHNMVISVVERLFD